MITSLIHSFLNSFFRHLIIVFTMIGITMALYTYTVAHKATAPQPHRVTYCWPNYSGAMLTPEGKSCDYSLDHYGVRKAS